MQRLLLLNFSFLTLSLVGGNSHAQIEPDAFVFFQEFCVDCHTGRTSEAGLDLSDSQNLTPSQLHDVIMQIERGQMPPAGHPIPAPNARDTIVDRLIDVIGQVHATQPLSPIVRIRRLNRTQYQNTIRDLIGVQIDAQKAFPVDGSAHGFDTVASALSVSPLLIEKYLDTAVQVTNEALVQPQALMKRTLRLEAEETGHVTFRDAPNQTKARVTVLGVTEDKHVRLLADYKLRHQLHLNQLPFHQTGDYIVRVFAAANRVAGQGPPRLQVIWQGRVVKELDVTDIVDTPGVYEAKIFAEAGRHILEFKNGYHVPRTPEYFRRQQGGERVGPELIIDAIEIDGPRTPEWPPRSHRLLFPQVKKSNEDQYVKIVLGKFLARAYRRPVREAELEQMLKLYQQTRDNSGSFLASIKTPLVATMVSPEFLLHGHDGTDPQYRTASALSYFLWNSMPDDTLFHLAANMQLDDVDQIAKQVQRMLHDPRSDSFIRSFVSQWLKTDQLGQVQPDEKLYPRYDNHLQSSMLEEPVALFREVLVNGHSVMALVDSDFAVLNERLARFYGIGDVHGDYFRVVRLPPEDHRGGLLTQGFMLTQTSNGTRTSPVKRGAWISENILGQTVPLPLSDVGEIGVTVPGIDKATVRERLLAHRDLKSCAVCHDRIDPLGFALENYDAVGRWREKEGFGYQGRVGKHDPEIDASGRFPDGQEFDGPDEFRRLLAGREQQFVACLCEKLLIYALGRSLGPSDIPTLRRLEEVAASNGNRLLPILVAIATSESFLKS